mmetsp:Transcript_21797/g.53884  ORF Transcript_21797/g.53884 Transcript_21797/m.53884 type:complete len:435 (-) Transcript_21797:1732-3036(-)
MKVSSSTILALMATGLSLASGQTCNPAVSETRTISYTSSGGALTFNFGDLPDAASNVKIYALFQADMGSSSSSSEYATVKIGSKSLFDLGRGTGSIYTSNSNCIRDYKTKTMSASEFNANHDTVTIVVDPTYSVGTFCGDDKGTVTVSYTRVCPTTPAPVATTPAPVASPTRNENGGTGGDPHFTTWNNKEHFEYHGQCDLTLVKDADFAAGLGLDIQIRTKIVRYWSYIKNVAIKIGNDILEIEGSADADDADAHYWINYEQQGDLDTGFAGFPVMQKLPSSYKRQYIIDLSSKYPGASIVVQLYKEFVRVKFNGDQSVFGNTVGLLGDYKTGELLARDGSTVFDDFTDFGDEWQVLPSESKLFHEIAHPQFPELCIKPEDPRGERKRRLAESTISIEQAEAACAMLNKDLLTIKDCVYDILATQDLDMVGAF